MRFILFFIFLFFLLLHILCARPTVHAAPCSCDAAPPPRLSTHSPHPLPCPPCISIFLVLLGAFGVGWKGVEKEVWLIIGCGAVCACCAAQRLLFLPACLLSLLSSLFFVFSVSLLLLLRFTSLPPCVCICECGHVGLHAPTTAPAHRPYRPSQCCCCCMCTAWWRVVSCSPMCSGVSITALRRRVGWRSCVVGTHNHM